MTIANFYNDLEPSERRMYSDANRESRKHKGGGIRGAYRQFKRERAALFAEEAIERQRIRNEKYIEQLRDAGALCHNDQHIFYKSAEDDRIHGDRMLYSGCLACALPERMLTDEELKELRASVERAKALVKDRPKSKKGKRKSESPYSDAALERKLREQGISSKGGRV